jgi:hypothetical protein
LAWRCRLMGLSRFACCPDGWVVSAYWCADIGPDGDQTAMEARCQHPGDGRKTLPRQVKATASGEARCPGCGAGSARRHSASVRSLQDLPVQGTIVELQVSVRRWRCCNMLCQRQTFVDRVDQALMPHARQTRRVAELARSIGYAAGGRPAERLMRRLGLPQGDDRILRHLKRHAASSDKPLRVVGIDAG